ncbi:MAG: hypothetical protein JSW25_05095, partial [Thermoplasmata archaeon]
WDETQPMVAGMKPDKEVQKWLEEEEDKRKAREEAEGKGVKGVEYTPGTTEMGSWGKRVFAIVVLAVILIPLMWYVVIPRADAELVIQYHEGVVGGISVDARIDNHGTRAMEQVQIRITVQDSSDTRMAEPSTFEGEVGAHGEASMSAISFTGDQWDTYHIFVEWSFRSANRNFSGSESYNTEGNQMNIWIHHDLTP